MGRLKTKKEPDVTFSFKISERERSELLLEVEKVVERLNSTIDTTKQTKFRNNQIIIKALREGLRRISKDSMPIPRLIGAKPARVK